MFSARSAQNKELLAGVVLRPPDVTFNQEANVDLGGVTARLLWFGGAHTKGDELTFVEPDRTLVSGDVVQNKTMPNIFGDGGTPATWLAVLDKVAALNAAHVLPDHSAPGDGSMVAAERDLITGIQTRALALKQQGVSAEDAGKQISGELKTQHPDWPNTNAGRIRQKCLCRTLILEQVAWAGGPSDSRKLLRPTPTRRKRCCGSMFTRSRRDSAMAGQLLQEAGGESGVWLRVRISNSLVLSLRTTVRAMRVSLREAAQTFSARRRMMGSISDNGTSVSKVSSAEMDFVGLSGTTALWSIPRVSS